MRNLLFLVLLLPVTTLLAQPYNATLSNINFLAANKIHKVGTDGSAAGNITLYTNVITIGAQSFDCIVRTVSISGGTFTLPGTPAANTIPFDYAGATGTGMTGNQDRFFSPTFNWNAAPGGSCRFRFTFILGGSYNDLTNTGTAVTLQNVGINSYDIDGNGSASSNQFNEFNNFSSYRIQTTGGNITTSYNAANGFTRFISSTTTNSTTLTADATRLYLEYNNVSDFEVVVGGAVGAAYYFLDFGSGSTWTVTPTLQSVPVLDLNTSTAGVNNTGSFCKDIVPFTSGTTNLTGTTGAINFAEITFQRSEILNGTQEMLIPKIPAAAADTIKLGFTANASQSYVISGVTYNVAMIFGGGSGVDTIRIAPPTGTFTTAQVETMLDALNYYNIRVPASSGTRNFNVSIRQGSFKTSPAVFAVSFGCPPLSISGTVLSDINGMNDNLVNGTGSNAGGVFINLVNSAGFVVSSKAVAADGSYSFVTADGIQPNTNYTFILSSAAVAYGASLSTASSPAAWGFTGEVLGTGSGNDGTTNGQLSVNMASADIANARFALNQRPLSTNKVDNVGVKLATGQLYLLDNFPLSGSDPELSPTANSLSNGASFVVKTLPNPLDATLFYNGVAITAANTTINNYNPDLFGIVFNRTSVTTTSFTYSVIDAAGLETATPASYTINLLQTLPVTGLNINGKLMANGTLRIEWSTLTELNAASYWVEQSKDAVRFSTVSTAIKAVGNSTQLQQYNWEYANYQSASGVFFRIKQVDVDGKTAYSKVWKATPAETQLTFSIYPNPAISHVFLNSAWVDGIVKVYNVQGQVVLQQPWKNGQAVSLTSLATGSYTIELSRADLKVQTRVVKQ
ncbi:T9SS type A sorting domain-containing protein [Phnomibacter sp. MR]|uniref:T9SS type A sorting domain-containing protein n=1 Tax=Phnomibacter sp. MR TaxID=3042318 RepID=UPI003A80EF32